MLPWGLGDVLLSTSAIRELKRLHPDQLVYFQTYVPGRRRLTYPMGAPSQMLEDNPDIAQVFDMADNVLSPHVSVQMHYAAFGGPPLDYPIQAHYWENLGLDWQDGQRFDAHYYPRESELLQARQLLGAGPHVVLTPGGGWPGKSWTDSGWMAVMDWALNNGITPVVLAGERIDKPGWHRRGVINLAAKTDIRQAAAILKRTDFAVMTEGGLSNLRFAVGGPTILLTCATQAGVQVWCPPELTTEVRMVTTEGRIHPVTVPLRKGMIGGNACEPCMWRGEHVLRDRPGLPPANIRHCPAGRSLRDVPPAAVIAALEEAIRAAA